jgi:hypothetical protein
MTKADLVRKHITEFPNVKSKKERARMLAELYPDIFEDGEGARRIVRAVTGSSGEQNRKHTAEKRFFYNGFEKWAEQNLNTEQRPWDEPFVIPSSIKQLNIIADLHSVHLDHKVLELFLRSTKDKEAVLLNGDLMDSESLSRHLIGHNVVAYETEIEICHKILKGLKEEFNHVYFKAGNHDSWLERYLLTNARHAFRALGTDLTLLLKCPELRVETIHNLSFMQYGDLDICHAHEFPGFGNGKFPATGLLDKWQTFRHKYNVKILGSHSHRVDHTISKKSKDGKFGEGWITPAMCRKGSSYAPYAGWDNGWAVAKITERGTEVEMTVI